MTGWSISSTLPFLAQENDITLESCTFRIIFCWPKLILLWGGMQTTFPHHCQAFPPSFLAQNYCHWCGAAQGKFMSWLCRPEWPWWCSAGAGWGWWGSAGWHHLVCTSCRFETPCSWWGIARVTEQRLNNLSNSFGPWAEFSTYLKRQGTINWQNKFLNVCKWTANTTTSVISFG